MWTTNRQWGQLSNFRGCPFYFSNLKRKREMFMTQIYTRYGQLSGVNHIQYYPNGNIKQLIVTEPNQIRTPYGVFTPQFSDDGLRRKRVKPVIFYENGSIKNLPLQDQVSVYTTVGSVPAELITWYETGEIKRIFPLNGSLTGFWTEDDEYEMAPYLDLNLSIGRFREKLISVQFYETKELKNFTIWPKDTVLVEAPFGLTEARIGVSFYPGGEVMALEPMKAIRVDTPIGRINAYDNSAQGIHGDHLSLQFYKSGQVKGLATAINSVTVTDPEGKEFNYGPRLGPNLFNLNGKVLIPLRISFNNNFVFFGENQEHSYDLADCRFTIKKVNLSEIHECSSCNGCSGCNVG